MVVSVTLSRGAMRMAERSVIVKRLAAIQDLGAMDVLCTDKTGTLTEARIRLERHVDARGRDSERVLELAYLNSHFETGIKSPLDEAILAHGRSTSSAGARSTRCRSISSGGASRCWSTTATRLLVVKGAPEDVLRLSTHDETAGGAASPPAMPARERSSSSTRSASRASGCSAVAWARWLATTTHAVVSDETELRSPASPRSSIRRKPSAAERSPRSRRPASP